MYHHPGEYVTDFCIVKKDSLYHLFHIRGERWTWPLGYKELDLGHATSTDLRSWIAHKPVLPAGARGAWDECGNWAPDIIEADGVYYCYYTGSDANNNQAIGLATSPDLFTWTKYGDAPVVEPGPWSDCHLGKDVAGRDAMVFHDSSRKRYLMYYTATLADGRACIALAQSQDLLHWADLGPTYIEDDRTYNRLESAYLVQHDQRYYLFYSAKGGPKSKGNAPADFAHFDIVYLISTDPTHGWERPHNHELLTEWTCASEHPTFDGVTYMLYIIQEEINGIWGASILSDPKQMVWQEDGTVQIREWLPPDLHRIPIYDSRQDGLEDWAHHGGTWRRDATGQITSPESAGTCMNPAWGRTIAVETEILLPAHGEAGLMVRSNPSAMAGYRISLDADSGIVRVARLTPGQPQTIVQERTVPLSTGRWHKLKVVVQEGFFDIYVDDALYLVRHEPTYLEGCFGLYAQGSAQFRAVAAYYHEEANGPKSAQRPDWATRCLPRYLFDTILRTQE